MLNLNLLATIIAAFTGAFLFDRLRVPAGALVGSMLAVAAVNIVSGHATRLPSWAGFGAFVVVGWLIGQSMTRDFIGTLAAAAVPMILAVAGMMVFGGALAWLIVKVSRVDPATAFLATSPGGLTQMAALSAAIGANASLVTVFHVLRVVLVVLAAPFVLRLLPAP